MFRSRYQQLPILAAALAVLTPACADYDDSSIRPHAPQPSVSASAIQSAPPEFPDIALPLIPGRPGIEVDTSATLPDELVGTWSTLEGQTYVAYRLDPDGVYGSVALLWQERRTGVFQFEVTEAGTVTAEGATLLFEPADAWHRLVDPGDPAGDFDRRFAADPTQRDWQLLPDGGTLLLTDEHGTTELTKVGSS